MKMLHSVYVVAALSGAAVTSMAIAHHGWSWAESEQITLEGTIQDIFIGPPHPVLKVSRDATVWTVELGNPSQTERAGFRQDSAKVGDRIVVLGNRSLEKSENRMKAVRVTVGGKTFDIYPERIRGS
jgi:hypothetical protein